MTYSPTKRNVVEVRQFLQRIVTRSMDEVHTAWGADSRDCQTFKSRFVDGGGERSHVARTKFVPGGSPNRRHRQERGHRYLYMQKDESFWNSSFL